MLKNILNIAIPHICFGCGQLSYKSICNECLDALIFINANYCQTCGKPTIEQVEACRDCRKKRKHFKIARSLFVYEGVAEKIIKGFKYEGGRFIANELLSHEYPIYKDLLECDLLTYIPSSIRKYLTRGYNPAEEIARTLSKLFDKSCQNTLIFKRPVTDQTELTKQERVKNLRAAFKIVAQINKQRVLLIDDVFTTGTTINQAALALKKAGAKEVNVFTLARRL